MLMVSVKKCIYFSVSHVSYYHDSCEDSDFIYKVSQKVRIHF